MNATELHPVMIKFICKKIEESLLRIGIVTTVKAEVRTRYDGKKYLYFLSQPFQTTPAIFRTLYMDGTCGSMEDDKDTNNTHYVLGVNLHLRWQQWTNGENGTEIGYVWFNISKNPPSDMKDDGKSFADVSYYVKVKRGLTLYV